MFTRYGIESQLDAMFSPVVQLRSGGYIVINQGLRRSWQLTSTPDVPRAEHHIEDTALKTKLLKRRKRLRVRCACLR